MHKLYKVGNAVMNTFSESQNYWCLRW